jgi:hypothetical protein
LADENVVSSEQTESRQRSTIEFPYLDLDDALAVTKGVNAVGGTSCQREQLAAKLDMAATAGGFNLRLGTAKMYGLLTYDRGTITLTPLGIRACDPQQEKAAKVEAFLTIPLYRKLYDNFKGTSLPPTAGLEGEIGTLGVAPKQKDKARQVFQRSAKQAGFFEFGNDRLVLPAMGKQTLDKLNDDNSSGNGIGSQHHSPPPPLTPPPPSYPPFIQGLLLTLPKEKAEWSKDERVKWLKLAALAFDVMYTDKNSKDSIKVEIERSKDVPTNSN